MTEGTKGDPWELTTPPGSSTYAMYRDPDGDPPALGVRRRIDDVEVPPVGDRGPARVAACPGRLGRARRGRREQTGGRRHGRGVGPVVHQSRRWMVRTSQGISRPIRDVPPASRSRLSVSPKSPTTRATTRCERSRRFGASHPPVTEGAEQQRPPRCRSPSRIHWNAQKREAG